MTAQEWVMKFGVKWDPDNKDIYDKNDDQVLMMGGNLEDIACYECGWRERFRIEVKVVSDVEDGSFDLDSPDYSSFDGDSYCRCCNCEEEGDVRHFKIKGLDKLLRHIYDDEITEPKFDAEPDPKLVEKLAAIVDEAVERNKQQAEQAQTIGWDTSNIKQ